MFSFIIVLLIIFLSVDILLFKAFPKAFNGRKYNIFPNVKAVVDAKNPNPPKKAGYMSKSSGINFGKIGENPFIISPANT